jgi:hypothetical protein
MRISMIRIFLILVLAASLPAFGKTKFVNTWASPDAIPEDWNGKKIAVFAITFVNASRFGAEADLAKELTKRGAVGIPGNSLIPKEWEKDKDKVKVALEEAGIAGAVIMRVMMVDQDYFASQGTLQYTGSYYPTFYGYWGYGWGAHYFPGSAGAATIIAIETLVYSIEQDKLLWAGTSKSKNPDKVDNFIGKLVDAVGKKIRKAGLVKK